MYVVKTCPDSSHKNLPDAGGIRGHPSQGKDTHVSQALAKMHTQEFSDRLPALCPTVDFYWHLRFRDVCGPWNGSVVVLLWQTVFGLGVCTVSPSFACYTKTHWCVWDSSAFIATTVVDIFSRIDFGLDISYLLGFMPLIWMGVVSWRENIIFV